MSIVSEDGVTRRPDAADRSPTDGLGHSSRARPSFDWVGELGGPEPGRSQAVARLHAVMLRGARHQVSRMRGMLPDAGPVLLDELSNAAADDATVVLLRKLHTFEGRSEFTTWAFKFAILEASTLVRRYAWSHRDIELPENVEVADRQPGPDLHAEAGDLARAVSTCIDQDLTPHQRRIAIALLVDGVPIDVLADRLQTTRGALYKTLHDARLRIRGRLTELGYLPTQGTS